MNEVKPKNILITGVSSGIGHSLAKVYLAGGHHVFGTSRRTPADLLQASRFRFEAVDFAAAGTVSPAIQTLLGTTARLHLIVLNAGTLGHFGDLQEAPLAELKQTMNINVWANKLVLDTLYSSAIAIDQVVAMSSGAAINGNRGWSGYSLSKAALNMLVKLYARERRETHFCALAPGLVDTAIQEELCSREPDDRFPALKVLRAKRHTSEMPLPDRAAVHLAEVFLRLPSLVASGDYADIRELPTVERDSNEHV